MVSRRFLRIKVLKEVYSFFIAHGDSPEAARKTLEHSIRKTYDLYHLLLLLAEELGDYAQRLLEHGLQKNIPTAEELHPNSKFVDNEFVALLRGNLPLRHYCEKQRLSWSGSPEVVKKLLAALYASDFFQQYMAAPDRSFAEDKALVIRLYNDLLEDFEPLLFALEEQSIYWTDDVEFTLSQIIKTLRQLRQGQSPDTPLMPLYRDDGDRLFAEKLLQRAITCSDEYHQLIDRHIKNWDVERVAFMDITIMTTAIAELVEFANIPVKVSLNEYIEIAKYYSTPYSSIFINGVLDRVVEDLKNSGLLNKIE
ncbi:MAG: transcription antitermination factor NusB [Prevotellaceae bacterium]|jgi:N utilization substance protein B|nr:transcription antitermination factor NusB [Prevotellaceae bacterium]